jgi:hypothetical protein
MFMTTERDSAGRLRVPFFAELITEQVTTYEAARFKRYVEQCGLLCTADWDSEKNGYPKWKHRVDRAAQKVFTGI